MFCYLGDRRTENGADNFAVDIGFSKMSLIAEKSDILLQ